MIFMFELHSTDKNLKKIISNINLFLEPWNVKLQVLGIIKDVVA
jgi:hypothetical protein